MQELSTLSQAQASQHSAADFFDDDLEIPITLDIDTLDIEIDDD